MVIDLEHLSNEAEQIKEKGISVTPDNLKLSKHATISMPWHKVQDELEENRLSATGSAFGSTRRGIAYAYSDKYRKKTLRLADLLHLDNENVKARLKTILDAKILNLPAVIIRNQCHILLSYRGVKNKQIYSGIIYVIQAFS